MTNAEIECYTRSSFLTLEKPIYTALSYTWGSEENKTSIKFNGQKRNVTRNLAEALRHLRSPTDQMMLWIDQLCINQEDNAEKSIQVGLMKDIYSYAAKTCIWLGEEADNSDLAMDIIKNLDGDDLTNPKNNLDQAELQAVAHLQARPWWSRVWVIQGKKSSPREANLKEGLTFLE